MLLPYETKFFRKNHFHPNMVHYPCLCCLGTCLVIVPFILCFCMASFVKFRKHKPHIDCYHLRRFNHRLSLFLLKCSHSPEWFDEFLVTEAITRHNKTFYRVTDVINYTF